MIIFEYYTADYDNYENVVNGGLSNKVFVTDTEKHTNTACNSIELALKHYPEIDEFIIYYQKNGVQYFKKLKYANSNE